MPFIARLLSLGIPLHSHFQHCCSCLRPPPPQCLSLAIALRTQFLSGDLDAAFSPGLQCPVARFRVSGISHSRLCGDELLLTPPGSCCCSSCYCCHHLSAIFSISVLLLTYIDSILPQKRYIILIFEFNI